MNEEPPFAESSSPSPGRENRPFHEQDRFWALVMHLSPLSGYLTASVGCFVGPILVWAMFKDRYPQLETEFREVLNFQISVFMYLVIGILVTIVTVGIGAIITLPAALFLAVFHIAMPIIGAIKANEGKPFSYPLTVRFLKG